MSRGTMFYSVYDPVTKQYDYFVAPGDDLHAPTPKHLKRHASSLGVAPEIAAWALPANARHVGHGLYAKGMIARPANGAALGDFIDDFPGGVTGLAVAGAVVLYFLWR